MVVICVAHHKAQWDDVQKICGGIIGAQVITGMKNQFVVARFKRVLGQDWAVGAAVGVGRRLGDLGGCAAINSEQFNP